MRRENEFFEVETPKMKLNILIGVLAIVTLLLTGTLFSNMTNADAASRTDLQTAEAYQINAATK